MVGLLDIAPVFETVEVGSAKVQVYGVSAKGIASLLYRFPELRVLASGKEFDFEQLWKMGGDIINAILAAGCGHAGDPAAESLVDKLPVEQQAALLEAIVRLTMPKGPGPFVERVTKLASSFIIDGSPATEPSTNLQ